MKQLSDEPWWTADWLEGIESSNLGDYPLLCRVEGAHAEFPPDPFYKVVKTDDNHDEMKVYFKKTKGFSSWKSFGKTHMRLAVTLRPILPVVCPDWNEAGICSTTPQLALPPSFTVATFPCELEPFLIPFAWGYSLTHSLYLNQKVLIRTDDDTQVRIDHFSSLVGRDALQLEDRTAGIQSILSKLNSTFSNAGLEKDLGNYHQSVPLRDARVVLNAWYGARKRLALKDGDASSSEQSIGCFVDLLRSTLPLWNSVTVMRNMYDRKKQKISPWCVVPAGKVKVFMSPWTLGEQVFRLEENLRVKIKCLLEDFVAGDQAVMEMFYHPVTDEVAPAYFCAVPVGKAFADIVQRLQLNGKQNACYYRSVDAIIADVESILECCLLYNSPDSEVVEEAARIVDTVKVQIARVTREYYREIKEARKMDEDWRLRVRRQCQFRTTFANIMKRPFREQLHRDWLDQTHDVCDPLKPLPNMIVDLNKPDAPVFQAGDMVLYSRELHCSFVKGHRTALEYDQCLVPSHESVFGQESSGLRVEDEWARGVIIWTRSSFPKASSKQSGGDTTTFPTLATLQCLGIKFRHSGNVCVLYWRPCLFQFDSSASTTCPVCGLFSSSSFVRFDCNGSLTAAVDLIAERENEVADSAMSTHLLQSLDRCLNLFKRRCIRAIHPDYIDPMLSKDNVKSGYKPPILKIGKNTLPSFERLFSIFPIKNVANTTHQGTRGISLKPKEKDPDVSLLVDVGFLPLWVSSDSGGIADDDQLRKVQALLPSPKLCLELVQLRIRNNFYRHKAAIENDIVEAYLYTMFALLVEPASRKRSPLSIERVARFLLVITKNIDGTRLDSEYAMMNEEFAWAQRLRTVQALYATALVSVSDTSHVERAFGLVGYSPPKPTKECDDQDLIRVAARQSLAFLVSAFGREKFLNVFHGEGKEDLVPQIKLTIKCGGELFTFSKDRFSPSGAQLLARLNDTTVKVNLICEGSPLGVNNAVRASLSQSIGANQKSRADYQGKRVAPPIYLGPKDCEHNDSLARMLFNRPGRTDACARCQAFKRSMLSCRVLCRHSNSDFNWVAVLSDGVGYVDDLLKVLSFEAPNELDAKIAVQDGGHKKNGFNNHEGVILNEDTSDPREFNKKAVSVLKLATENLKEAKLFAAAPARLSKDFVKKSFPIDLSDGHYLYCVICGSSGDLLCCDGCPNVVHGDCVELSDLPDGDWYCEECCAEKSTGSSEGLDLSEKGSLTPFGRVELDESKVELLSTLLDELRNARPTPKRSSNDDAMENPDSNGRSSKKRRGRPRKHTRLALGDGLGEGSDGDGPSLGSQSDGTFPKKKRSLPRNKFRSNQATGDERSEVSRSRSAKTENETCVNRSGPNTDEDIILKRTRKRRRKSTDALDIDLSRARHLSRRRLVVKTQPPANEDVNIVRKISGRRNLKRRLSTSPNAKPVIQLSAQGLKGVRNFASFPFHDTFPQPVLIKAKADGIGSEVLSVDSSSSVPRRNRSSPRKSCPPIRFVDTI